MYNNIFKTAVIDCDVSHRFIKSVTHPQSFPCQGKEVSITPFGKGSRLCCGFVVALLWFYDYKAEGVADFPRALSISRVRCLAQIYQISNPSSVLPLSREGCDYNSL